MNVVNLNDKTKASFRHIDGQAKVTFHGLDNETRLFPKGVQVTVPMLQKLYENLKAKRCKVCKRIHNEENCQ